MEYIGQIVKDVEIKSYVRTKRLAEYRDDSRAATNQFFD
jgi:hypothetical protein